MRFQSGDIRIAAVRAAAPGLSIILAGHTHHANAARLVGSDDGADGAFAGTWRASPRRDLGDSRSSARDLPGHRIKDERTVTAGQEGTPS